MAHQQPIIEMEDSDDEEVNESFPARRPGTLSDQPDWSLFAPPNDSNEHEEDDKLSEGDNVTNDRDDEHRSQQPGPSTSVFNSNNNNPPSHPRLVDLLNKAVPGPSTSRHTRQITPSPPSNHLASLPGTSEDERIRSLLGLPPFDSDSGPSTADMFSENTLMEDALDDHSGPLLSLDASNTAPTKQRISEYQCPICFSPPSHACLTPCGHVMCAQCLFSSVRAARERHVRLYGRGAGPDGEGKVSRCPVCRAVIKGWDGKGGGVFGLKMEMKGTNERTEIVMPF